MTGTWRDHAACAGHDPEVWYASATTAAGLRRTEAARDVCWGECGVRLACLGAALNDERDAAASQRWGIRGGLDGRQRWRIRQQLAARKAVA